MCKCVHARVLSSLLRNLAAALFYLVYATSKKCELLVSYF